MCKNNRHKNPTPELNTVLIWHGKRTEYCPCHRHNLCVRVSGEYGQQFLKMSRLVALSHRSKSWAGRYGGLYLSADDKFQFYSLGLQDYKVTVKSLIDRGEEGAYNITISCQDKGSPPLYAESKFSITVMNVGDVWLRFSKETHCF